MKSSIFTPLFILAALGFSTAHASDAMPAVELAKANGCLSCHSITEKIVGPSYQDVSSKYANDKDAVASLVQSIRNGSVGKWSKRIPMPAHPNLSNEDMTILAKWVLAQKH